MHFQSLFFINSQWIFDYISGLVLCCRLLSFRLVCFWTQHLYRTKRNVGGIHFWSIFSRRRRWIILGRVSLLGTVCQWFSGRTKGFSQWQRIAKKRTELSLLKVWSLVFNKEYYAATYESRMWGGKEDPVHDLSKAVPKEMELGATHKAITSGIRSTRLRVRCAKHCNRWLTGSWHLLWIVLHNLVSKLHIYTT